MILYSTRIPMKKGFDRENFLFSILKWNQNGKYQIAGLEEKIYSKSFEVTDGNNTMSTITLEDELTTAVRVHNENKGGIWNTDLILNEDQHMLTVCVDRMMQDTTVLMKGFANVPGIVSVLIEDGFAGHNLGFPVSNTAVIISDENKAALDAMIHIESGFVLPMVYLSSRSKLDADKLAERLAGLATVLLDNADILKSDYPEPIYIFFPNKNMKPRAFGDYPLHREIAIAIVEYLNQQTYTGVDTWNGVKNTLLDIESRMIAKKYQDAASENETLLELQEDSIKQEQKNKDERERLLAEINKLRAENAGLTNRLEKLEIGSKPFLHMGAEKDLYYDEHLEIVIEILRDHLKKSVDPASRRHDVLQSILEANPIKGLPEQYRQIIKNAFDGYTDFSSKKIQDALREVGIEVIGHTGHYKMAFHGDERYTYEAAATPSDHRAGKNVSADISRLMF